MTTNDLRNDIDADARAVTALEQLMQLHVELLLDTHGEQLRAALMRLFTALPEREARIIRDRFSDRQLAAAHRSLAAYHAAAWGEQ